MPRSGRLPGYISGMPFSKRSKLFAIGWHRSGAHGAVRNAIQAAPDQPYMTLLPRAPPFRHV
jgi:hypothetical protein